MHSFDIKLDTVQTPRERFREDVAQNGRTYYELLDVAPYASREEILDSYSRLRSRIGRQRRQMGEVAWGKAMDELDRGVFCLTNSQSKKTYDAFLNSKKKPPRSNQMPGRNSAARRTGRPRHDHQSPHASAARKNSRSGPRVRPKTIRTSSSKRPRALAGAGSVENFDSTGARFEPLQLIGYGRNGTKVFAAHDYTLSRAVAIKRLVKSARTKSRRDDFLEEARFLASVSHTNLVEVHGVLEHKSSAIMEFLPKTVPEYFADHPESGSNYEQVAKFLKQGLSVLEFLHSQGVVHGGIRLQSFRAGSAGVMKLTDAPGRAENGLFRTPSEDQRCVAPELLSPETFGTPTATVDLYMLGFAGLELLARDKLTKWFRKVGNKNAATPKQWLRWHSSPFESLPNLMEFVPAIPVALVSVIEKLCQKQVSARYQSATEALADLKLVGTSVPAAPVNRLFSVDDDEDIDAVEDMGGAAPLLVEASETDDASPDLLEILQDPSQIWRILRENRIAQGVCAAVAAMLMIVILNGPDTNAEVTRPIVASDIERRFEIDDTIEESSPINTPVEKSEPYEVVNRRLPVLPSASNGNTVVEFQDVRPIIPPASSFVELTRIKKLPVRQDAPLEAPSFEFPVAGIRGDAEFEKYRSALQHLSQATGAVGRRKWLAAAVKLAPQDPRSYFVYAGTFKFDSRGNDELLKSIQLNQEDRFTQPFRIWIEQMLGKKHVKPDVVFTELCDFRDQLSRREFSTDDLYEWGWIGRVFGYLERESQSNPEAQRIVKANWPRIMMNNDKQALAAIEHGRQTVLQQTVSEYTPRTFFAFEPYSEVSRCLKTLSNKTIDPTAGRTSLVALDDWSKD